MTHAQYASFLEGVKSSTKVRDIIFCWKVV